MKRYSIFRLGIAVILMLPVLSWAQSPDDENWPKVISASDGGKITIYQPQPDNFSGNKITGRAAVSYQKTDKSDPVFGAMFFDAYISTDKDSRTAVLQSITVTNAKFPGVEDSTKVAGLVNTITQDAPKWNLEISLDQLIATINENNPDGSDSKDQFNNKPPTIYYRDKPTTLVLLDGEPKIQHDKDLDADRVVNSPFFIFKEGKQWNLYCGGIWYKSSAVTSGWSQNKNLSQKVQSVDQQIKKQEKESNNGQPTTTKPEVTDILVTTQPAELLQTKGEPEYKTIPGVDLLYVSNTPNQIFKDINSQLTYVLLGGRWYTAKAMNGPWDYIASDKLPGDFAKIPEGSEKDAVLASIAGTPAAEEAKIDATIPQTAKVDRKTAKIDVKYDGTPKFKSIEGTSLKLAENANVTVMQDASGKYFALENGVWFTSDGVNGPWVVANERPKDVDKIPPSSSAYNTKYVYVYQTTPEYVYVGYTPGYMGCYVYGPTIVYGTGFYYPPWFGAYYYPRPVTWGFGFSYNPWTGWGMHVGFSVGFMSVGFHFGGGYGGWWGPPMYRPPYRPPYARPVYHGGNTNININNININNNRNNIYNNRPGVDTRDVNRGNNGSFNRPTAGTRPAGGNNGGNRPTAGTRPATGGASPSTRPANNNVFADRNGNVMQRDNNGNWNQRDNRTNSWQPARNNQSNMNRANEQRQRGMNNYNQSRNYNSRPSGGGARMSGGGGRRR